MSSGTVTIDGNNDGFPRVSGDELDELSMSDLNFTFSPRERG